MDYLSSSFVKMNMKYEMTTSRSQAPYHDAMFVFQRNVQRQVNNKC